MIIKSLLKSFIILMTISSTLTAQELTFRITKIPSDTDSSELYLACDLNNWNPHDENFKFEKVANGFQQLTINNATKAFEYKVTMGSWESSESYPDGNPIKNRMFIPSAAQKIIDLEIAGWTKPNEKKHTAASYVTIISENFEIPQLNTARKIWLYLPPDYHQTRKKYPVIYMHDGQNLFDDFTSFSGEWSVDETMNAIYSESGQSAIVVGIDNGSGERLNEYSPWGNPKYKTTGKGDLYVDFIVSTLKPYIDRTYRTQTQASNTIMMGSSMGGLISLYAAVKYPNKFGRAGIFSPAFWFSSKNLKEYLNRNKNNLKQSKFYFVAGKKEDESMVPEIKAIDSLLLKRKIPEKNIIVKIDEDGTHSEAYWKRELRQALLWLLK